jgi:hypothetical protein
VGAATGRSVLADGRNATGTSIGAALLALGAGARLGGEYEAVATGPADVEALAGYARDWRRLVDAANVGADGDFAAGFRE